MNLYCMDCLPNEDVTCLGQLLSAGGCVGSIELLGW